MPADAPSLPFPAKGSLKRVPFTQLIRELSRSKITGNLYLLTEGNKKKVVFFDAGVPVFVRSNQISETLGQTLAQDGLITQEQCDNTLESVRRTGKRQGELLVEHGILSRGNLQYGLLRQLRIKLLEIFAWEDGRFQFKEGGERPDTSDAELEEPTEALIIAGVQERYTDERARGLLAELAGRYPLVNRHYRDRLDELDLLPEEQFVLSTLDGSRKVEDV
ncbi:MAG: DUF4388 domain-containing protein, partial [Myxococcales bacterium]|nr:DUF4388 domain-containing protein [Myxococcales bacterium]